MAVDPRLFILVGIAAIFAGARLLWEGIRAIRKRYFKFSLGRRVNDQVFRGNKARRIGVPVMLIGLILIIGGWQMIFAYQTFNFIGVAVLVGLISLVGAWALIEMSSIHR